jgi:hypothetical protein
MTVELHTLDYPDSRQMTTEQNLRVNPVGFDRNITRKPDRYIHLFSISQKPLKIERPPLYPLLKIPPCPKDKPWIKVASIPDPHPQAIKDEDKGRIVLAPDPIDYSGLRVAVDLIDSNNLGYSLDWSCPEDAIAIVQTGAGCNLAQQGVFLDFSETPSDQELAKAKNRRHKYYEALRMNANLLEKTDAKKLANEVFFNEDYHFMADYFGLEYSWHSAMSQTVECKNCGERIKENIAFHKGSDGMDCVLDWKRYFLAGKCDKEKYDSVMALLEPKPKASGAAART